MTEPDQSEGIYYVARFPTGWQLLAYRFRAQSDFGHSEFWEEHVVSELATAWSRHFTEKQGAGQRSESHLHTELGMLVYGFPRGRVVQTGERYRVFHGNDLKSSMGINRAEIEKAFGITGLAQWEFDEHERCQAHDRDAVRALLGLKEAWPATESLL